MADLRVAGLPEAVRGTGLGGGAARPPHRQLPVQRQRPAAGLALPGRRRGHRAGVARPLFGQRDRGLPALRPGGAGPDPAVGSGGVDLPAQRPPARGAGAGALRAGADLDRLSAGAGDGGGQDLRGLDPRDHAGSPAGLRARAAAAA